MNLLAYCGAVCVDAVATKGGSQSERLAHADMIAQELTLDMARWFTLTAENYFGKITKPGIVNALTDAGRSTAAWQKAKKTELATIAAREIDGTGWLPEQPRSPRCSTEIV